MTDEQIVAAARRCFLERGARVSAEDIARELGLTHTTLFNRFGSKEALMVAALRPPEKIPSVAAFEAGPDDRPIRKQLVEHCKVMSGYFDELQAGLAVYRPPASHPGRRITGAEEPTSRCRRSKRSPRACAANRRRPPRAIVTSSASSSSCGMG